MNEMIHFPFFLFSLFSNISNSLVHFTDMKRVGLVEYCFMKLNDKLMLGFQENQSFFHVINSCTLHVESINWWRGWL